MPDSIANAEQADATTLANITDADELAQFLKDRWSENVLDDDVHDAKSAEAGQINNDGMGEQIAYLAGGNVPGLARTLAESLYSYSPPTTPLSTPTTFEGTHMLDESDFRITARDIAIDDHDSGVSYHFWTNGTALGYEVHFPDRIEFFYLNPSAGSDDGVPTVFVYQGTEADPNADTPLHHYVIDDMVPGQSPWQTKIDSIEATLTAMTEDDRNDAIEALRSRFDDGLYTRERHA